MALEEKALLGQDQWNRVAQNRRKTLHKNLLRVPEDQHAQEKENILEKMAFFTIGAEVNPDVFAGVLRELEERPLLVNRFRKGSGEGRSQCFGLVRQRNNTYCGSSLNFKRPELYQELLILANRILPAEFHWLSIQVNQNYMTSPHYDSGNRGNSAILAFGDYEGGELVVSGTPVSIKNRLVYFDGSVHLHSTLPFTGNRYSLVFHTPARDFLEVPRFGFVMDVRGRMMLEEELSGVTRHYNRSGFCVFSSDGATVLKRSRLPTLRPCVSQIETLD